MKKVICIGNATWDQTYTVEQSQLQGSKSFADSFIEGGGGIAATAAVAIASCGSNVEFVGRTGKDKIGDQLQEELQAYGVGTSFVIRYPQVQSSIATVILDEEKNANKFVFNDLHMPKDTASLFNIDLSDVSIVIADLTWYEGVKVLFDRAKEMAIPTLLRVSFYDEKIFELMILSDYLVFTHPALVAMTGDINHFRAMKKAKKHLGGIQIVTLGNRGCAYHLNNEQVMINSPQVKLVDSTGSGDIFVGIFGMLIGLGANFSYAIEKANLISSLSCEYMGARGFSILSQLQELIDIEQESCMWKTMNSDNM